MGTQRDILMFSTADWDHPYWTNKQHMAVMFARHGYRVLYVESLGLRRPTVCASDMRRIAGRLLRAVPRRRRLMPGVWGISPLVLPFSAPAAQTLNRSLLTMMIRWHLRSLGMKRPLIWTYNPTIAKLCASLPRCGIVYHCVDDLGGSPGIDAGAIERGQAALAEVADICFVTSRPLQASLSNMFSKTVYEPNVCDPEFFVTARSGLGEPVELRGIPRPRALFIGALSEYKVDFDLLRETARRLSGVHFILVGPVGEGQPGTCRPPILPNVHLMGPKPYKMLPQLMAHADVAILPVPRNRYADSMFPMKFFEYLSAGLPVVGTSIPALEEFGDLFFVARTAQDFAREISRVLAGERRDAEKIGEACRKHSWEARFLRMESAISGLFRVDEALTPRAEDTPAP